MKKDNVILEKSYLFSKKIVKLYLFLKAEKREYELGRQILRSGTSIGANIEEAVGGLSSRDFINRLGISYKEARETMYWLRLLKDTDLIEEKIFTSMYKDCEEILKILTSIIKTLKLKDQVKSKTK